MQRKMVNGVVDMMKSRKQGWKLDKVYETSHGYHCLMVKGDGAVDARDGVAPLDELTVAESYGNGHGWYIDEAGNRVEV